MFRIRILALLLLALLVAACVGGSERARETQVTEIAESWLRLLDLGNYDDAWALTAPYYKSIVSHDDFLLRVQAPRQPLGNVVTREVLRTRFSLYAKGRPDGQYFIVIFQTSFQGKRSDTFEHTLLEITPTGWRVTDYVLR